MPALFTIFKNSDFDPFEKLKGIFKVSCLFSSVTSMIDQANTYKRTEILSSKMVLIYFTKHTLFYFAVTAAYVTTLLVLKQIRKKDDQLTYGLSAIPSCGIIYSLTKNGPLAFAVGLCSVTALALIRNEYMNGSEPFNFTGIASNKHYRVALPFADISPKEW